MSSDRLNEILSEFEERSREKPSLVAAREMAVALVGAERERDELRTALSNLQVRHGAGSVGVPQGSNTRSERQSGGGEGSSLDPGRASEFDPAGLSASVPTQDAAKQRPPKETDVLPGSRVLSAEEVAQVREGLVLLSAWCDGPMLGHLEAQESGRKALSILDGTPHSTHGGDMARDEAHRRWEEDVGTPEAP